MTWKHLLWMVIGCSLPLLLIFLAPLIGISSNWSTFIFVIAMFGCHLLMPMHHHAHKESQKSNHESHTH